MPNKQGADSPSAKPNNQSPSPRPNSTFPNQSVVAQGRQDNPSQESGNSSEIAKELHWVHHATFWTQVGLGLIAICALWIYHKQLCALIDSNRINRSALESVQRAFVYSHATR